MNRGQQARLLAIAESLGKSTNVLDRDAAVAMHELLAPRCTHRIVDARNKVVQSGFMCIDCGAVFAGIHPATQPVLIEAGIAGAMPGTDAWTITVCSAETVPTGTQLYKKGV
jgi:hypothetical protein